MKTYSEDVAWEFYEQVTEKRFEQTFDSHLKQVNSMQNYQELFESLLSRVDISESHAISLFVGGLFKEVGLPVKMFKPRTLVDIYSVARLQESIMAATKSRNNPIMPTPRLNTSNNNYSQYMPMTYAAKNALLALPAPVTNNNRASTSRTVPMNVNPRRQITQR